MTVTEQVIQALQTNPDGLTVDEIAKNINGNADSIGGICHRLTIQKKAHTFGWRASNTGRLSSVYRPGKMPTDARIPAPPARPAREVRVTTMFTSSEHQKIYAAAKAKGIPPSKFMRNAALEKCEASDA